MYCHFLRGEEPNTENPDARWNSPSFSVSCSKSATVEEKLGHLVGEEENRAKQGWRGAGKTLYVTRAEPDDSHHQVLNFFTRSSSRLSCLGLAFGSNVSKKDVCVVKVLHTLTESHLHAFTKVLKKRSWFYQEEERAPEFLNTIQYTRLHTPLPKAHGPHICILPAPPNLCGLAAYRQSLVCGMTAFLILSFRGSYLDRTPNTLWTPRWSLNTGPSPGSFDLKV